MSRLIHVLPALLWAACMFYFSSSPALGLPAVPVSWMDFVIKKFSHISEYAMLDILIWFALYGKNRIQNAFLIGLFYAFTDEIHQLFVPGRTGAIRDAVLFDGTGLLVGSIILKFWRRAYAK